MAGTLSAEKQKAYKDQFSKFDKNHDNKMDKKELGALLRSLNRNPGEATLGKLMTQIDVNKSGFIEYDEFVTLMIGFDKAIENGLKKTFDRFDKDKNGLMSAKELGNAFKEHEVELSDAGLAGAIKSVDIDGDGQLNFAEFKKLFAKI